MTAEMRRTETDRLMRARRYVAFAGVAVAVVCSTAVRAIAANSYDSCVGFIDAPNFIPKPGT